MSNNLIKISASAPQPYMHVDVAPRFEQLRKAVLEASGIDFLAKCGDVLRDAGLRSAKVGVAFRSWHKTGRAFDYDQTSRAIVVVSEPAGGKQFFRTYLKCAAQDGSQGKRLRVLDFRQFYVSQYLVDFTALAEAAGFQRIPAWAGWKHTYTEMEFWHYAREEGLTWDQAMQQIKGHADIASQKSAIVAGKSIIGLNDRDQNTNGRVTMIQNALYKAGRLDANQIDGTYGSHTLAAVSAFQRLNGLAVDGTVGPLTAANLGVTL